MSLSQAGFDAQQSRYATETRDDASTRVFVASLAAILPKRKSLDYFRSRRDVSIADIYGETPLSRALFTGNKDVVKRLIDSGANVKCKIEIIIAACSRKP
jgi:ankyrin repeat protein